MRWASARCKPQFGGARLGEACHGAVGRSMVRRSMARVADGSTEGQPSLLLSMGAVRAWRGPARRGAIWPGEAGLSMAGFGQARAIDDGTEVYASLPSSQGWLRRHLAWSIRARLGVAGCG